MTDIEEQERCEVFVGVDVGKGAHHAVALNVAGKRLLDSALPNDEAKLRALITKLKEHGFGCCSSSINLRRSALFRLRWHELKVSQSPTCRDLRCAASLTCMGEAKTDARPPATETH
jgi:hypothetical protein